MATQPTEQFGLGEVVWAKADGYTWWPARVRYIIYVDITQAPPQPQRKVPPPVLRPQMFVSIPINEAPSWKPRSWPSMSKNPQHLRTKKT